MMLCACLLDVHPADVGLRVRGRDAPDPVHSRTIKREVRKQQREQAKRLAWQRRGT